MFWDRDRISPSKVHTGKVTTCQLRFDGGKFVLGKGRCALSPIEYWKAFVAIARRFRFKIEGICQLMDNLAISLVHGWQSETARNVSVAPQEETCPKDSEEA